MNMEPESLLSVVDSAFAGLRHMRERSAPQLTPAANLSKSLTSSLKPLILLGDAGLPTVDTQPRRGNIR